MDDEQASPAGGPAIDETALDETVESVPAPRWAKGRAFVSLMAAGAIAFYAVRGKDAAEIEELFAPLGPWQAPLFVVAYAAGTVLLVPGSLLTLAGGALFGPWLGTAVNLSGATLGASGAFLLARYLGADWVRKRLGGGIAKLIAGVEADGWRFVAFARLTPIFPFSLLNYALGLTRISARGYMGATAIFMLPGCFAYTYVGHAGRAALTTSMDGIRPALLALALLAATAYLSPKLSARLRRRSAADSSDGS